MARQTSSWTTRDKPLHDLERFAETKTAELLNKEDTLTQCYGRAGQVGGRVSSNKSPTGLHYDDDDDNKDIPTP